MQKMMRDFKVVGYMPAWKTSKLGKIRYDVLTHIIYSFAFPDGETGDLMIPNLDKANDILAIAHKHDVKVILSVGGWTDFGHSHKDRMISAIEDENDSNRFISNIVSAVYDLTFDGVDLNWGNLDVSKEYEDKISAFTMKLKNELEKVGKTLSVSVLGNSIENNEIVSFEVSACNKNVIDSVDWINVISYENRVGVRKTNTNLKIEEELTKAIKIPNEKVVMGIPFFINMSLTAYSDVLKESMEAENIKNNILTCGREIYCIADEEFVKKVEWAKKNAIGVDVWEITQDFSDVENSLLTKIKDTVGIKKAAFDA